MKLTSSIAENESSNEDRFQYPGGAKVRTPIGLLALVAAFPVSIVEAQKCPVAGVFYIVRSEDGTTLNEAELKAVQERSPTPVGDDVGIFLAAVSIAPDGTYRAPQAEPRIPVLHFRGATNDCFLHLDEVTLVRQDRKMRLTFNVTLPPPLPTRDASQVRPGVQVDDHPLVAGFVIVDSPTFREGTYELELDRWRADVGRQRSGGIPAISSKYWAEVRDPP